MMARRAGYRLRALLWVESLLIMGSVVAAYLLHWRIPLPAWLAVPAGVLLWGGGLLYTLRRRGEWKARRGRGRRRMFPGGYPLVWARGAMHLGVALGFRSWPTLGAAVVFLAVNLFLAARARRVVLERVWELAEGGKFPRRV
ncbi:MAG: hypothetical protein QME89_05640 [Actinomycetota bacterium]|nr:hypothetical protein [Actinomycetota bacterium]